MEGVGCIHSARPFFSLWCLFCPALPPNPHTLFQSNAMQWTAENLRVTNLIKIGQKEIYLEDKSLLPEKFSFCSVYGLHGLVSFTSPIASGW